MQYFDNTQGHVQHIMLAIRQDLVIAIFWRCARTC